MINLNLFSLAIIFSCTLTLFQCNSSDTKKDNETKKNKNEANFNPFYPVKEGNYWIYINEAPRDESKLFTVKASDIKKVESAIQAKMSSFPYLTKEDSAKTITVKSNGEIEITDYFYSNGVIIPSADNFKKGYQWNFGIFGGSVNSDNETIKTEAGTFDNCCYIMITEGFTFSFEMWFKKDVGIVKWGANRTNPPSLQVYYVLKEYKVN